MVVIGAPTEGAAYVFQKRGDRSWQEVARLVPDTKTYWFGSSVAIDGRTIAVGSPVQNGYRGSVYLYRQLSDGRWKQSATLSHPAKRAGTAFGSSLALEGNTLLVGARADDGRVAKSGAVHMYHLDDIE
jgi:hypothetical protein